MQKKVLEEFKSELLGKEFDGNLFIDMPLQITPKKTRIVDAGALLIKRVKDVITLKWLKIAQIGKTDKNGNPVKREQEAIDEIEAASGIKVQFYDYKNKKNDKKTN